MKAVLLFSALVGWLAPLPGAPAAPVNAQDERAFVEIVAARDTYFVHEPIELEIRMGVDRDFLQSDVIQLFRRELEVPLQLDAPWLQEPTGATRLPSEEETGPTFALGEEIVGLRRAGEREVEGRIFSVFSIRRRFLATEPGELVVPPVTLRFAYATEFRDDLFEGRVPVDRHDASVASAPLELTVRPLPEEGRPLFFTGAVGRFTIEAETSATSLAVGESFKLLVHLRGEGSLGHFDWPEWTELEGFHRLGALEDRDESGRHLMLDLAPLDDLPGVPALPFAFFEPGPARYRIIETEPIPLEILGAEPPVEPSEAAVDLRAVPGVDDIHELKRGRSGGGRRSLSPIAAILCLVLPWMAGFGLVSWRRIRERERLDPEGARARRAARRFQKQIARESIEPDRALAEYLSAHLRCSPAGAIDPELAKRLEARGAPPDLALRAAGLLEALVASRFGGRPVENARDEAAAAVVLLEPHLRGGAA